MIKRKFDQKELKIVPISDIHIGAPNCDIELLKGMVQYIKKSKSQCILLGDMIDNYTRAKAEKRGIFYAYEQQMSPEEQIEKVSKILKPIRKQILCLYAGNHERWTREEVGIDVSKIIAKNLGVPYEGYSGFIKIQVKNQVYRIFCHHGIGMGATPTGALNSLFRLAKVSPDADIYLMGHVHKILVYKEPFMSAYNRKYKKKYYIVNGHFLDYKGSYAETWGLPLGAKGCVKIKLYGDSWDVHVSL